MRIGADHLCRRSLESLLLEFDAETGLDCCLPVTLTHGDLVAVRGVELAAALSRLRGVSVTA